MDNLATWHGSTKQGSTKAVVVVTQAALWFSLQQLGHFVSATCSVLQYHLTEIGPFVIAQAHGHNMSQLFLNAVLINSDLRINTFVDVGIRLRSNLTLAGTVLVPLVCPTANILCQV